MNRFSADIHQHLWPAPFLAALRRRTTPPFMDGWSLVLDSGAYAIDAAAHDADARAAQDELDLIAVAPSAALGIDRLPAADAAPLLDAWREGASALPRPFAWWTGGLAADRLAEDLAAGAIGLELAADRLLDLDAVAPLLHTLEDAGRPVLVHPGPVVASPARPGWWEPVVPYVADLHAAWWAWIDDGRARFPRLPVVFAALAGLGPLHGERQRARGGDYSRVDPLTFVETSTYGAQAVDATIRVLGIDLVCFGSDRPYAEPPRLRLDPAAEVAIRSRNPQRLFSNSNVLQEVTS